MFLRELIDGPINHQWWGNSLYAHEKSVQKGTGVVTYKATHFQFSLKFWSVWPYRQSLAHPNWRVCGLIGSQVSGLIGSQVSGLIGSHPCIPCEMTIRNNVGGNLRRRAAMVWSLYRGNEKSRKKIHIKFSIILISSFSCKLGFIFLHARIYVSHLKDEMGNSLFYSYQNILHRKYPCSQFSHQQFLSRLTLLSSGWTGLSGSMIEGFVRSVWFWLFLELFAFRSKLRRSAVRIFGMLSAERRRTNISSKGMNISTKGSKK